MEAAPHQIAMPQPSTQETSKEP